MAEIPNSLNPNIVDASQQAPVIQTPGAGAVEEPAQFSTHLLQKDTHALVEVPQDHIEVAVRSGQYFPKKDAEFVILNQDNERFTIQGSELKKALDSGYRLENSEGRYNRELQEQYGDLSGQIGAFGAGTARGATIGLSDVAGAAGGQGQNLSKLEEANPIASTAGEIVGTLGGLLIGTGEAGLAAKVAGAGMRAVEGAGIVAEKAMLKAATKAGLSSKVGSQIVGKMAAGAAEGAIVGGGQLLSENALGKADFNAENVAMALGTGALIGGTLGGGLSAVGAGVNKATELGKSAFEKFGQPIQKAFETSVDENRAAAKLLGVSDSQLTKLKGRAPGLVDDLQSFVRDDLKLTMSDNANSLNTKLQALKKGAGDEIDSVLNEMKVITDANPALKTSGPEVWNNIYKKVYTKFEDLLTLGEAGTSTEVKQVTKFLDQIDSMSKKGTDLDAIGLQKFKKLQDDLLNFEKTPGKWTLKEDMAYATRTALKEEIQSMADRLGADSKFGSRLKEANRLYHATSTFEDFVEKASDRGINLGTAGLDAVKELGLNIKDKMAVLGTIQKAQNAVGKLAKDAINSFASVAPKSSAVRMPMTTSVIDSAFGKKFDNGKYKKPKSTAEAYANMQDNFERYKQDPEAFISRVNRTTAQMYKHAPETSTQLDALAVRGGLFLASKIPKRTTNPGIAGLLKPIQPPSKTDLAKFERYLTAVEEPKKIFEAIKQGRLSREHVEAIQVVYPNIYAQLQSAAMEMVQKSPSMPYNKKLQLGVLLNVPTDESLLPENVLGLQANFAQQGMEQTPGTIKTSQSGLKELDKSGRSATSLESTEKSLHS